MKTKKKIQKTVEVEEIIDVTCNKCNKSICVDGCYSTKGASFDVDFWYGSNKDGCVFRFELCDDCFDKLTKSFLTQPDIDYYV